MLAHTTGNNKIINITSVKGLCVLLVLFAGFILDAEFSASLFWQFYAFSVCLILIITLFKLSMKRWRNEIILPMTAIGILLSLNFINLTPLKPFMRFHRNISNGMTIDGVDQLFNRYFPNNGRFRRPIISVGNGSLITPYDNKPQIAGVPDKSLQYVLDPDDGRYNAEWLIIYFNDKRVVGSEYLSD